MYHCKYVINIISKNETIKETLSSIPAMERFEHIFIMDSTPQNESVKKADLIIWDTERAPEEIQGTLSFIHANKKEDAEIILSLTAFVANAFAEDGFEGIDQMWIKPYSTERLRFMFTQYMKGVKQEKDSWLTSHYLDALIDGIPDMVWFKDKVGSHLKVNQTFCDVVNKTKEQVQGRGHYYIWNIEPEEYSKGEYICMESEAEVMHAKKTCVFEEKVKVKNEMRTLCTYKTPLFDLDGSVMGTVGLAHDITDSKK